MKKIFAAMLLLAGVSTLSYGQCDKKVVLTSSKTEHLGADSAVQDTKDEQTVVEFDKTNITVVAGGEDHKMTGTVTSYNCNWSTPFKEGKTVIKVALSDHDGGDTKKITITIEGKGGKVRLLAEMDDDGNRKIRLNADSFTEKNG
jgi:hypothetical protein